MLLRSRSYSVLAHCSGGINRKPLKDKLARNPLWESGWRSYMMIKCYIAISMKIVRGGTTFYFLTRDHWWHLSKIIPSMKDISNHQTCIRWLLGGTSCVWGYCWTAIHFKRIPCLQLRFVASIATFDNFRSGRGPASWQLRLGNFTLRNFLAWVK